jgi:anti-anti-sigma factor
VYGNRSFDCAGARIRALCRQLATVVTIEGEIDGANVDRVSEYIRRFILAEKSFVLDLSTLNSLSPQGISLLQTVDDYCFTAAVEWSLVAGEPVKQVLRTLGDQAPFPIMSSVHEALHHFSDLMLERRRLLPLLSKTA